MESLVWVFAFLAGVVFMLLQWSREMKERRARQRRLREQIEPAKPSYEAQPEEQHETVTRSTPSADDWGRGSARPAPALPDGLELQPVTPEVVVAEIPPRVVHEPARAYAPAVAYARIPPPPPRRRVRKRFRTPHEVREGIIALTVLGPCRALAPYGEDEASPSF